MLTKVNFNKNFLKKGTNGEFIGSGSWGSRGSSELRDPGSLSQQISVSCSFLASFPILFFKYLSSLPIEEAGGPRPEAAQGLQYTMLATSEEKAPRSYCSQERAGLPLGPGMVLP